MNSNSAEKPKINLNAGHRKRLLERFMRDNGGNFYDYELLELLLCYAIPRKDVKPIAKELLLRFGSIAAVLNAEKHDLVGVKNIGESTAGLLKIVKALNEKLLYQNLQEVEILDNPNLVADFVRLKIGGGRKETFMVIYLNSHNGIINFECHAGTVDRTTVYNRELAEKALGCRAANVIVAHNHPSGFCDPSEEDINFTRSLQKSLNTLGIKLHDHMIVSVNNYYSLRKSNLIPKDMVE